MITLLIVIHTIVCLFLICIVLLQHGKGADIGASFGGSSQSLFGTEGPLPLLNKITTLAAITGSVMSDIKVQAQQQTPAQTAPVTIPIPAAKPAATEQPKEQPKGQNNK